MAVEENQQGYDSSNHDFFCTPSSSSVSLTYYSDSNNPDPTSPPPGLFRNFLPNIVFEGITQSCSTPSLNLESLTATSASISWDAADVETFEYALQQAGDSVPESGTIIENSSIEFTDLTQGQEYEFFLRSVCGDTTTDWFSISFTPRNSGFSFTITHALGDTDTSQSVKA